MYTRAPSASLLADRGAAFTVVVIFHIALGYAFYSGLITTIVNRIPPPIDLLPVREQQRAEPLPPAPQIQFQALVAPNPEQPGVTTPDDDGPRVVTSTPADIATGNPPAVPAAPVITPVRMDPRHPLKIGPDHYPDSAVRLNQQGRCVVSVGVAADGRIVDFSLQSSSGFEVLDKACLDGVRGQRMLPALQDGKPVQSRASIPIVWKLESH